MIQIKSNKYKGVILIILASLFFSLMATTVKSVNEFPLVQKVFFRNLIGLVILSSFIVKDKAILKLNNKKLIFARSAFGLIGVFFYYKSLTMLNLSEAVVINKLSPFFVIIIGYVVLKEKIKFTQIIAVAIALVGIIVLVRPQVNIDILPAFIGIAGAISAASAYTIIRELSKTDSTITIVFYFCLISTLVTLPFLIPVFVIPTFLEFIGLSLIGVFALAAQLLMTQAYRYAPASQLSIYTYFNILFSTVLGVIFWKESLSYTFLIGAGLIVFAGYINFYSVNEKNT